MSSRPERYFYRQKLPYILSLCFGWRGLQQTRAGQWCVSYIYIKIDEATHALSHLVSQTLTDSLQEQKYTLGRPTDADLLGPGAGITPGSSGALIAATCRDQKPLQLSLYWFLYLQVHVMHQYYCRPQKISAHHAAKGHQRA